EAVGRRGGDVLRRTARGLHAPQRRPETAPLHRRVRQGTRSQFLPGRAAPACSPAIWRAFPVFVMLGGLDRPDLIEPKLEMFSKRRLTWARPLDLPQFEGMPR